MRHSVSSILLIVFLFETNTAHSSIIFHHNLADSLKQDTVQHSLKCHISGHLRNYFMSTWNEGILSDHFANAIGASLNYQSKNWRGFDWGIQTSYTLKTLSSELSGTASVSKAKWELELFDTQSPDKKELIRLDQAFLRYSSKRLMLQIGRIDIDEGPLLKKRDGRMMPFVYQGFWSTIRAGKVSKVYNGFINGVAPRGMSNWYSLENAIGLFNNGHMDDSTAINYLSKGNSKGMIVNGIRSEFSDDLTFDFWNYYLLHLDNTSWFQLDWKHNNFHFGGQYVLQVPDPYQKNLNLNERYFGRQTSSNSISLQVKYTFSKKFSARVAQLYISGDGKFIFPRELTRESFYTSIQRSWADGLGKSSITLTELSYHQEKPHKYDLQISVFGQFVNAPSPIDYDRNKYGAVDYFQGNLEIKYKPIALLDGLNINLLYIHRYSTRAMIQNSSIYYRTNFAHFNLIVEYKF